MKLTQQQVEQMKARGLSDADITTLATERGYEMPDTRDFLTKANDVVGSIFAGQKVGEAIGTLGGYAYQKVKDKIKGTNVADYYDLSAPSPLQVAGDIALGASQVAGAKMPVSKTILGKTLQFGTLGATGSGAEAIAEGKGANEVLKETISGGAKSALIGFTFGVAEKGLQKGTEMINRAGEKIQAKVIMPTKADLEDGFDLKTIKEFDLGGSLKDTFKKTNQQLDDLSKQLNTKLEANKTPIDLNDVFEKTVKRLSGNKLSAFGTQKQMSGALERLQGEIVEAVGKNGITTIPEAQIIKRASGHLGAWNYGNTTPDAKASEKVFNAFYTELKTAIEEASPEGVREINKQMSKLIPVLNAVIRRMPVAERNSIVGLPDMLSLVGATIEPKALALTLANLAQKSGKVGNALTRVGGLGQGALQKAEQVTQAIIPR
jgi:hypothetical protein